MPYILGIIPARGGSKGIPGKNIVPVVGRPLIAYTIEAAKGSTFLTDILISTDSKSIARCAEDCGIRCDTFRPAKLATDEAKTIDVVSYELLRYEEIHQVRVDVVVVLQPTVPLRSSQDIDESLKIFFKRKATSLVSVCEAISAHPRTMYYLDGEHLIPLLDEGKRLIRRQDVKKVFLRNGALYIANRELITEKNTLVDENPLAYIMPEERSVNIDSQFELMIVKCILSQKNGTPL